MNETVPFTYEAAIGGSIVNETVPIISLPFCLLPAYTFQGVGGADRLARTESKRGRPDLRGSIELDVHLMTTAAKLFIEQGYDGTSMGQIVAAAGAGKQSLYRRYANKEALFKEMFANFLMKNIINKCNEQLNIFSSQLHNAEYNLEVLKNFGRQSFDFMLEYETVETFRLFVSERGRFPELRTQVRQMIQGIESEITRHIQRAQQEHLIRIDIDRDIARNFMALINEGPLVNALLELTSVETAANRDRYFAAAWRAFIDSVTVRSCQTDS